MNRFKIVFFDCDGVLLFGHPLSRLEDELNIREFLKQQWEGYYSGNLKFHDWIKNIENYYKKSGLTKEFYEKVIDIRDYQINKEAEVLIAYLKDNGYEIAIISSGSEEYVGKVAEYFGIKYHRVNTILVFDKYGNFVNLDTHGEDPEVKVDQVKEICDLLDVSPEETVFIGDSDNDLKAFEYTKHGILYGPPHVGFEKVAWKRVDDLRKVISILENENKP